MSRQISPRLGRVDVVLDSFCSCISNRSEEFSRAPKMPSSEIIPQPRMLLHQLEGAVSFKKLQCLADRHCWRQLNKQMHMVNSDVKLVNFTSMIDSNFADEALTINFDPKKLEGVPRILAFPYKMESVLPEGMTKTLQIHFFAPELAENFTAHANSTNFHGGLVSSPHDAQGFQEDKFMEGGIPPVLESTGILPMM